MLISCLAHFDSFLNNITKLVLYKNPNKALGDHRVPVSVLLSKTRIETISDFISKKVAEVSRKDFFDRLEFIRLVTGESLSLSQFEKSVLKKLSDQRNKVVHEQQHAAFTLKEDLSLEACFDDEGSEIEINEIEFCVPQNIVVTIYTDLMRYTLGREMNTDERKVAVRLQQALGWDDAVGAVRNTPDGLSEDR